MIDVRENRYQEYCEWSVTALADRLVDAEVETERLTRALRLAEARIGGAALYVEQADARSNMLEGALTVYEGTADERDRYRLAWLSARRRAADEANFGMEALELKEQEIARLASDRNAWQRGHETAESQLVFERRENARLTAELSALREPTHGAPELEHVGTDEDGDVYRLKRS